MPCKLIWHLDLDSFFVSAERLREPCLRGKPMAVGGTGPRSVISSASYEARKFGVRSAQPTAQALRLCPQLLLRHPDMAYYSALSKKVFALLDEFTPIHERVSVDEAYLDMTGTEALHGAPLVAAAKLRRRILETSGLTASVGMASNRLVAKIATDQCKPDKQLLVASGTEPAFLAPLPVAVIPGCGKVTQAWLRDRGIETIGKLQKYPLDVIEKHLGKFGHYLHRAAWGQGSTEFHEAAKRPGISREQTFDEDVSDPRALKRVLWEMVTDLGRTLREEGVFARAIKLKLRYPPFDTVTRSRALKGPTQLDDELYEMLQNLFDESWEPGAPLRLLGVGCAVGDGEKQLGLFENRAQEKRRETIDTLKDALRKKFGDHALKTGRDIK